MTYLDTHVLVWLYASADTKISATAGEAIENATDLRISPMVLLEIDFLHEIERISVTSKEIYAYLHHQIGLRLCDRVFADIAVMAAAQSWTRDPFDRLIVAQAALGDDLLISKDSLIQSNYSATIW